MSELIPTSEPVTWLALLGSGIATLFAYVNRREIRRHQERRDEETAAAVVETAKQAAAVIIETSEKAATALIETAKIVARELPALQIERGGE